MTSCNTTSFDIPPVFHATFTVITADAAVSALPATDSLSGVIVKDRLNLDEVALRVESGV